ncbi:MAG: dihydroorotase [Myxococcota bacterium]|nr:dihydroorotase [Myxococcota bacterium]
MEWLFDDVHLLCPADGIDKKGAVWIREGKIYAILSKQESSELQASWGKESVQRQVLSFEGHILTPMFSDILAYVGLPSALHREDLDTLSAAARAGGFGHIAIGPHDGQAYDSLNSVGYMISKLVDYPNIRLIASLTRDGSILCELGRFIESGVCGFFQGPIRDTTVFRRALQYARPYGMPVIVRPVDADLEDVGTMHEGLVSNRIGLRGISTASEEVGLSRLIALVRDSGCPVHCSQISSAQGVRQLARAKEEGLPITGGVAARSLLLDEHYIEENSYNSFGHLRPPLRTKEDREALVEGVLDGTIDSVFADHQSCSSVEKECEFALSVPGALGLETAVSATFTAIKDPTRWVQSLQYTSSIVGGEQRLRKGETASFVLFNPKITWRPKPPYQSRGRNEPLESQILQGRVVGSFQDGNWTYTLSNDSVII